MLGAGNDQLVRDVGPDRTTASGDEYPAEGAHARSLHALALKLSFMVLFSCS
jgi:hypothetical protein